MPFSHILILRKWQALEPSCSPLARDRHMYPLIFLYKIETLTIFTGSFWHNVYLAAFSHKVNLLYHFYNIFRKWQFGSNMLFVFTFDHINHGLLIWIRNRKLTGYKNLHFKWPSLESCGYPLVRDSHMCPLSFSYKIECSGTFIWSLFRYNVYF